MDEVEGPGTVAGGCLRAALVGLGVLGALGVLAWAVVWAAIDIVGPDPTDVAGWGLYLHVAEAWAVGVVVLGIGRAYGGRRRTRRSATAWLLCGDLGFLLAVAWPVQALIGAFAYARAARGRPRRLRALAVVAGVGVLVGGGIWGVRAYEVEQPWSPARSGDSSFLGTWRGPDGARLVIRPGGAFQASGFGGNGDGFWPPQLYSRGSWSLAQEEDRSQLVLTPVPADGDAEHRAVLAVYGGGVGPTTLCMSLSTPFGWCVLGLHR